MQRKCLLCNRPGKDTFEINSLIALRMHTDLEMAEICGPPIREIDILFHRNTCMPEEFHGKSPTKPGPNDPPQTAAQRLDQLHASLSRVLRVGVHQVEQKDEVSPGDAEAISKVSEQIRSSIELTARVCGELNEKTANSAVRTQLGVVIMPTVHGKTDDEIKRMVSEGVQSAQIEASKTIDAVQDPR